MRHLSLFALFVFGCATQKSAEPEKVELPAWIAQGKQTWGNEQEGFFGIGTGDPSIEDQEMRQHVAEEQARAAAMHEFEGWYVTWLREHPEGDVGEQADIANRAQANLQITERWIGPDGRTFALAHLALDFMKK
jgi:hypothetical protein